MPARSRRSCRGTGTGLTGRSRKSPGPKITGVRDFQSATLAHMPADEVVLRACGLVKRYRQTMAVAGIDLSVHKGERVGLLGPNGAGKTTTLMMLLGVVRPD